MSGASGLDVSSPGATRALTDFAAFGLCQIWGNLSGRSANRGPMLVKFGYLSL